MTSSKASGAFWTRVESELKCSVPTYLKNVLRMRGFDDALSIRTLTDEDIQSLETFGRTKMRKFIAADANAEDYYHMFAGEPESFEFLPGHIRLLKEIVKHVAGMTVKHGTAIYDPDSTIDSYMNHSRRGSDIKVDLRHEDKLFIDPTESRHEEKLTDPIELCQKESDDKLPITKEEESFKALILCGTPDYFYIQTESSQDELDELQAKLEPASTWPVLENAMVGDLCAAIFDGAYYRAIILSLDDDAAKVHYIDYGNDAFSSDLRTLPEYLRNRRHLAICCSLPLETGVFSAQLNDRFVNLPTDDAFDMNFVCKDSNPAIVRLFVDGVPFAENEETVNSVAVEMPAKCISDTNPTTRSQIPSNVLDSGSSSKPHEPNAFEKQFDDVLESNKRFDEIIETMSQLVTQNMPPKQQDEAQSESDEMPKFTESAPLNDDDFVVVRYVESAKLFAVQRTQNIVEYNAMMDRLSAHCATAPVVHKPRIGMACAAFYKDDSERYRAEILNIRTGKAVTSFVDYGVEVVVEVDKLKEIGSDFLTVPKQAIYCRLLGYEMLQTVSSAQETMEFMVENSVGERRNFHVKVHGHDNGIALVNLIDEKEAPFMDLSMGLLRLSLPKDVFLQYEKTLHKPPSPPQRTGASPPIGSDSTTVLNNGSNGNKTRFIPSNNLNSYRKPETANFEENRSHINRDNLQAPRPLRRAGVEPIVEIPPPIVFITEILDAKLSWFVSPLEFYVTTIKSDAELSYTTQMKNIHHFYKDKTPVTKRAPSGSFVIAKYEENNQMHRARIIEFNEKAGKYVVQFVDVGTVAAIGASNIFELDARFATLECQAIKCSFDGVVVRANLSDLDMVIERLMVDKILTCRFIKKKGDTLYVDVHVNGSNVKDVLIQEKYLSKLPKDVEVERLVGQTVMAQIESFRSMNSFQIVIYGCPTTFEASCSKSSDKTLSKGDTITIRIDRLLVGKTFSVTPLMEIFGETPPSPICRISFFSDNFQVFVMHWEEYNIAYVQSVHGQNFAELLLAELFNFYDKGGDRLQEFVPQTLCAAKSLDENWYRAEIISETQTDVNVRYVDYGNCELIPKLRVKRLDAKFFNAAALAVKVFLPLQKLYTDGDMPVDDNVQLTEGTALDLEVLEFYAQNWIVDLLKDNVSITADIKAKIPCKTMRLEDLKKQIDDIEMIQKVARLQVEKQRNDRDTKMQPSVSKVQPPVKIVAPPPPPTKMQPQATTVNREIQPTSATSRNIQPATVPTKQQEDTKTPAGRSSKTKAYMSHIDRPDRFYLQVSSTCDELDQMQENIQIVAPSLPPLKNFATDSRCIVRYAGDGQWYRGTVIDSDAKDTSILFIDYGNTDTITDNSCIRSMNEAFDQIPPYAIPCALPLEARDRIEWSEESCELLKNLLDAEVEFEYVCKGKSNNLVKLYQGGRDIMQELIQNGHAIKLESITTGDGCYVSHANSISDFYMHKEGDTDALEKVYDYLLNVSKFEVMTDVKEGVVCAAKYADDGLWYRAKILSHNSDSTEVFFIDYGNASRTNELRIIPSEIASAPSLAKHCSLVKPEDIQCWSDSAEQRFVDFVEKGTTFKVNVISPGEKSVVDLFVDGKSILEEISNLCDKSSLRAVEKTIQSNAKTSETSTTFNAFIVEGSPSQFYIQKEDDSDTLNELWVSLENAPKWPVLKEVVVGRMCASFFEGFYYRAKILSLRERGANVHYVDYGNHAFSSDLRELPEELQHRKPMAMCCRLESKDGTFSPEMVERFSNLAGEGPHKMKFVSVGASSAIVELFENGVKFE